MRSTFWLVGLGVAAWLGIQAARPVTVYDVFSATGASPTGYAINDWVTIPADEGSVTLAAAAKALGRRLGLDGVPSRTFGPTWVKWEMTRSVGSVATRVLAERLASGTTYLVVDRSVAGGLTAYQEAVPAAASVLAPFGAVHQNVTLIGTVSGKLGPERERAFMARILTDASAAEVNAVSTGHLVSLSAYGPRLGPALTYAGHRVNLEVALAYNPVTRSTEVLVGSPVITVTY